GIADVGQNRQTAQISDDLAKEFEPFTCKIAGLDRQARGVAARPRQTRDQAAPNGIIRHREHDRDDRCRLLCRKSRGSRRDNDIDLELHELGRDLGVAFGASLRPAILDRNIATLDPAEFAQSLHKSSGPGLQAEGVPEPKNPMVGSLPPCCARAAWSHAAAAPPSSVMNSRRLITRSPRRRPEAGRTGPRGRALWRFAG